MAVQVKLTAVSTDTHDWSNQYGGFRDFKVRAILDGDDKGNEVFAVTRKLDGQGNCRVPQVGDQFEAELQPHGDFPTKLKRIDRSAGGGSSSSGGGGGQQEVGYRTHPINAAEMGRAHAQEMALAWFTLLGQAPPDGLPGLDHAIDHFYADVQQAGRAVEAGKTPGQQQTDGDGFGGEQAPPPDDESIPF